MRKELKLIEYIEKYIAGDLTPGEKAIFESRIEKHPHLAEQIEEQKALLEGLDRYAIRKAVEQGYKSYKWKKGIKYLGGSLGAILIITALVLTMWNRNEDKALPIPNAQHVEQEAKVSEPSVFEKIEEVFIDEPSSSEAQVESLDGIEEFQQVIQYSVPTDKDTVIETPAGIVMVIPKGVFLDENNKPVKGPVDLTFEEYLSPSAILKKGLSTTSNGELLVTGGMFNIQAYQGKKELEIDQEKGIYLEVPTDEVNQDMQLYDGEETKDGINWVKPKPLANFLTPVEITTLDFYPANFIDSVASLGFDHTDKRIRDSVYYSMARLYFKEEEGCEYEFAAKNGFEIEEVCYKMIGDDLLELTARVREKNKGEEEIELLGEVATLGVRLQFELHTEAYELLPNREVKYLDKRKKRVEIRQHVKVLDWDEILKGEVIDDSFQSLTNPGLIIEADPVPQSDVAVEYDFEFKLSGKSDITSYQTISPLTIQAFWNFKYNNTLVATQEFEERIKLIHQTCDEQVLNAYVKNAGLKMYEADSLAMFYAPDEHKEAFRAFYELKEGSVKGAALYASALNTFYEKKKKVLAEVLNKTIQLERAKRRELKKKITASQNRLSELELKREAENLRIETDKNILAVAKEIGVNPRRYLSSYRRSRNTNDHFGFKWKNVNTPKYRFVIRNTGWKNLDWLYGATSTRTNITYQQNGKTKSITYSEFSVEISSNDANVYLIPKSLYSFQKMDKVGDQKFSFKLNDDLEYDLLAFEINGDQVRFTEFAKINAGSKRIELDKTISIEEWEKRMDKKYKRTISNELKEEMRLIQMINASIEKREKEKQIQKIQQKLIPVVYPCYYASEALH